MNKRNILVLGVIFLVGVILFSNLIFAQDNETIILGGREFTKFGNVTIESSILNTLNNDQRMEVGIWIDSPDEKDLNESIKTQIIERLEDEFELTYNDYGRNSFGGYLTLKGLKRLENETNHEIIIAEITGGTILDGDSNFKEEISIPFLICIIVTLIIISLIIIYLIKRKR